MSGNIVFLIPIVAIVGGIALAAYKAYLSSKSDMKSYNTANDELKNQIDELKQEVVDLQERTKVLEKIVTSQNYDLKSEINSL